MLCCVWGTPLAGARVGGLWGLVDHRCCVQDDGLWRLPSLPCCVIKTTCCYLPLPPLTCEFDLAVCTHRHQVHTLHGGRTHLYTDHPQLLMKEYFSQWNATYHTSAFKFQHAPYILIKNTVWLSKHLGSTPTPTCLDTVRHVMSLSTCVCVHSPPSSVNCFLTPQGPDKLLLPSLT